ncbi:hypothetical protein SH661x_000406 [Planctomicrobium sp. SH661]|uniref:hypothetical protein n=1 Tax=Planctomicrobium sp. SH661 TaxID=3448124 RepID=UPI003F5C6598
MPTNFTDIINHAVLITTPFESLLKEDVAVPEKFNLVRGQLERRRRAGEVIDYQEPAPLPTVRAIVFLDHCQPRQLQLAIVLELGVLARLRISREQMADMHEGAPWTAAKGPAPKDSILLDAWVFGYDSAGAIAWIDGHRQKMSWGFIARCADTAYAPIPEFESEKMRRTFDCDHLAASLAAR